MDRRNVTAEAIKRAAARSAKASAAIEGRTVPEGFVRSTKVQKFLDERPLRTR